MSKFDQAERILFTNRVDWRNWLEMNHTDSQGIWVVSWKKHTKKPAMSYDEMVCEALCFGWIDSKPSKLDDDRAMLWFSPRNTKSAWSALNKIRVEKLMAQQLMHSAGLRLVELAKQNGTWTKLDDVEQLIIPNDLRVVFDQYPGSLNHFEQFSRSTRRGMLEWVKQAKRPETRIKRIIEIAEQAARNEKANQWRGSS